MSETIVILAPDNSRQEDVERSDLGTPLNLETLLNPLAVLQEVLVIHNNHSASSKDLLG